MPIIRFSKLAIAIGLSIASTSALASPQTALSARAFAMGGTGVAVAQPSAAASANPAMMAAQQHEWVDDFGLTIPSINARLADEEEVVDQIDDIQDLIDDLDASISSFDVSNPDINSLQTSAGELSDRLADLNRDTMRANIGAGVSLAVPSPRLAVGVFANGNLTATVRGEVPDEDRAFLNQLRDAEDADNVAKLLKSDNSEYINEDGSLALNSKGRILASAVTEVGVSFARTFDIEGETLQLGVSPKFVKLQTFQYSEGVADFDDDDFDASDYETDKTGFNLDLGAAYAFGENNEWNTGVVVKNLIPMKLDSAQERLELDEKKHTLKLDPMVTAGIAHSGDFHVLTAELDLTKKEAFGYEDDTQWLAFGAEFDAWRWAQLRAGVRQNLASNSDNDGIEEDTQFTAGIGLNAFGARLDLAGLYSSADVGAALEFGVAF